jgi:Spy/CpxP family protein refolding chaperone
VTELTETLELKLVEPNVHKHRKLCETKREYQDALKAAFTANCTSQSAANDVWSTTTRAGTRRMNSKSTSRNSVAEVTINLTKTTLQDLTAKRSP